MVQKIAALSALERYLRVIGLTLYKLNFGSVFPLSRFKPLFSAVLQILLSAAEGCGVLRKVHVLITVKYGSSRSSRYICRSLHL